jgi:Resolvase, N terminal domain
VNTSSGPAAHKISPSHLGRDAYVYIRQSTRTQVMMNTESLARQYELAGRAGHLGWHTARIVTIDADLGQSGARSDGRLGFKELVADAGPGKAGIVLGIEVSRLARNNADWYQLLGAPRGAVYSCGDGRAPPPGRRSGLVKLEAA